jgi:hypothetical protein
MSIGSFPLGSGVLGGQPGALIADQENLVIGGWVLTGQLIAKTLTGHDELNGRSTLSLTVKKGGTAFAPMVGQEVRFEYNGARLFGGVVERFRLAVTPVSNEVFYEIQAADNTRLAERRLVAKDYSGQTDSQIVSDLVASFLSQDGVTAGTIQTGITLATFPANWLSCAEILDDLAELAGFQWKIDPYKGLQYAQMGSVRSPFVLNSATVSVHAVEVESERGNYRNRQVLRGGQGVSSATTETFKGDGQRRTYPLAYPVHAVSAVTVNGTPQTVGIRDVDIGKQWYFADNEHEFNQGLTDTPLTSSDVLSVTYDYYYPPIAIARNEAQITARQTIEGGSGLYESMESDQEIDDLDLLNDKTLALLRRHGRIARTVTVTVFQYGLAPRQLATIDLPEHGLSGEWLIESVELNERTGKRSGFAWTARLIDGESLGGWQDWFKRLREARRIRVRRENEIVQFIQQITGDIASGSDVLSTPTLESGIGIVDIGKVGRCRVGP